VESAKASLKTRQAEVQRATALLKQAENDESRAQDLARENPDFISQSEMDQILYQRKQLEAQLSVAEAGVDQAEAALLQSKAAVTEVTASQARAKATVSQAKANMLRSELNRDYTVIKSPVDGIVIDRKIEPGQTLTAQFQTPELYTIAPNMREEIYVYASVDEADIGLIREAKAKDAKVEFTVDAYPEDLFDGSIKEVRFSSTMTQNVVTYPVIVSAANPELKLLPGMTASISFYIDKKEDILKVPNTALRFYPEKKYVHPDDHEILDGAGRSEEEEEELATGEPPVGEKADAAIEQHRRHVWVADGEKLRAIEVVTGIRDHEYTELVSGELEKGKKLVIGVKN
jgi:HlyD family secretion protein